MKNDIKFESLTENYVFIHPEDKNVKLLWSKHYQDGVFICKLKDLNRKHVVLMAENDAHMLSLTPLKVYSLNGNNEYMGFTIDNYNMFLRYKGETITFNEKV